MRRVYLDRPFIEGMVTDQPSYKLGQRQSEYAQDLIAPNGIARQRKGWAYDGTTADVADNLVGIWRNKFLLADVTRTVTIDDDSEFRIHNSASAGTLQQALGSGQWLPRCVYRDELIICAQDGLQPLRRYAGANITGTIDDGVASGTPNYNSGESRVVDTSYSSAPGVGAYLTPLSNGAPTLVPLWMRIIESSTTSNLLDGIYTANPDTFSSVNAQSLGYAFPCVGIYDAGTVTFNTGTITGYGTKWSTGPITLRTTQSTGNDGMVVTPVGQDAFFYAIYSLTDDDTVAAGGGSGANLTAKSSYLMTRRCNWTDAAAHKGSLCGTGNAYYPNRVYISPPGWNPAFPPGFPLPFDPSQRWSSANANDYLLDFVDVPTAYEGDVNVAILSTPNPLLVLKRSAVYGIYGSYPNFSVDKVIDGAGCIDIRSAISGPNGQFWAGEDGIFAYVGGQVIDLTNGKINREWRSLTEDFDFGTNDYCAIGESNDHLLVSIVTAGGTIDRCYVYDLRNQSWISRFSNHKARYFFSSKVDGEQAELYWVGDNDQGRVMKSSMVFDGTGLTKDGDGTSPRMQAWTGMGMDGTESVDNDARLLDLAVSHNVYDTGAEGSTQMTVSLVSGGSLESQANSTKTVGTIDSDATDRIDRTRFRHVNAKGRYHQIRLDVPTLGTNNISTKIEVPEISATVRDRRSRT